MQVKSC